MQGLIMTAQLISALSILIIIHEFGHFWAARAFGIKVEKFYLFFDAWGFKLFHFKKGETEWGIGWLPLGGYVKIAGMIDESMDKEAMKQPAQPWEFRSKPAWQRLVVMTGGVIMNIILGIFIFAMMSFYYGEKKIVNASIQNGIIPSALAQEIGFQEGDKLVALNGKPIKYLDDALNPNELLSENVYYEVLRDGAPVRIQLPADFILKLSKDEKSIFFNIRTPFVVEEIVPNSAAETAGLIAGDKIVEVNDTAVLFFHQFQALLKNHTKQKLNMLVLRGMDSVSLEVTPDVDGKIGFKPKLTDIVDETIKYGFFESFPKGANKAYQTIVTQVKSFKRIFNGDIPANEALQGPIGIARIYGGTWDWLRFWELTGLILLVLAFMNILPIPALDGGHVVLLCIEMITRKPINEKAMEVIQTIGMIILLSLMVFVFGNDIWRLISR